MSAVAQLEAPSGASIFALNAPQMAALGYSPVPIGAGTKFPAVKVWQKHCNLPPTLDEMAAYFLIHNAGIGLAMGSRVGDYQVVAIDVDVEGADLEKILSSLPDSPMAKVGKKGVTRLYRAEMSVRTKRYNDASGRRLVDLQGHGTQIVCPPTIHPDTNEPYYWLGPMTAAQDLPLLTSDDFDRFEDTLESLGHVRGTPVAATTIVAASGLPTPVGVNDNERSTWRQLNDHALANLDLWVPQLQNLYTLSKPARGGYEAVNLMRGSSTGACLADRKPSLKIHPKGVIDEGTGQTFTPIDLVMALNGGTKFTAAKWLDDATCFTPAALPVPPSKFTFDDQDANSGLSISWLIKDLLPDVGVSTLWGQSASGKGFVSIDMAASIATGQPFFGHRIKKTGGTLFALGEGVKSMPKRMNALRVGRFNGIAPNNPVTGEPMDLKRLPLMWMPVKELSKEANFKAFATDVRNAATAMLAQHEVPLRMLVVDTAVASFGFAEDPDGSGVTNALKTLDGLVQEMGILAVAIHHAGKSVEAGMHGSYAWFSSSETSICVNCDRNATLGTTSNHRLALVKDRDGGNDGWNAAFDLKRVALGFDEDGDEISSAIVVPNSVAANAYGSVTSSGGTQGERFLAALTPVFAETSVAIPCDLYEDQTTVDACKIGLVKAEYLRNGSGTAEAVRRRYDRDLASAMNAGRVTRFDADNGEVWVWPMS